MRTFEKNQFCLVEIDREKQKRGGAVDDRFGLDALEKPFYQCESELEKD